MRSSLTLLAAGLLLTQTAYAQSPAPKQEDPAPRQPRAAIPGPNAEPGVPQGEKTKTPDFSAEEHMPKLSSDQTAAIGSKLRSEAGETLGTVENVVIDREGHVIALVVGVDKLLGLAEDKIEIPWEQVRFERKNAEADFVTAFTKDDLRSQAKFSPPKRQGG